MADDLLGSLMDDFINLAEGNVQKTGIWREEPVDLVTFFSSKDFCNERPYPGKQTELLEKCNDILWYKMTGDDKLCAEDLRQVTELVVMFGKGSGKDFLASGILAYVGYLLACMNDPQDYFGFGQDENIDLVNVAINAYQANNVYFKKLKARLNNCPWFKRVSQEPKSPNEFQLTKNQIRFYKNITAHSAHSEADSFEGYNPLVIIFDEIAGFEYDKAEDAYATFRSSALSRYESKSFMIFISFPRSQDDFMFKKYEEFLQGDPEVYGMIGKTWEVNTSKSQASFKKDYDRDPEGSMMKYECIPPKYKEGLFQFPERIDEVIQVGKQSQCSNLVVQTKISTRTLQNGVERHFLGLEVHNLNLDPSFTYYLGGDGGVETDSYCISLFHAEPTVIQVNENGEIVEKWVNKPVEDLILEWKPSKKERLPVDLLNVAEILEMICQQVHVKKALFDKFNSADVVQRLMQYGVEAEDKNWSNPFQLQIYTNLKGLIYTGMIELLDHIIPDETHMNANEELRHMKLINGNKIDHDKDKTKDFSDARAGASWICSTDEVESIEHFAMPVIQGARRKA
ncbi:MULTISPECIES: hypothetical protein [unclassified Paenibacillus]|uniref:hypothetical protein n=1 Tax=unclassified Paenibacillus TaxID=185978 RepID=UPI00089633FD|nr:MULTISPECIES: hypothetical protein [unclassified Paenibacillus]OMC68663.1 hypothetical protein BK126_12610 [Paenibacillus sp. FSL H7-0326]SDW55825.1 hypothetical protein SAMN05518848_102171 [Paenibacillus sp. PDC88]